MNIITLQKLQSMLSAGCHAVRDHKEQTDSINIFPVPDKDTGTNLATTVTAITLALQDQTFPSSKLFADTIINAALVAAQGNSGIMMTSWLQGFLTSLSEKESYTTQELFNAFTTGYTQAMNAVEHPQSGTMLDVMHAATVPWEHTTDLADAMEQSMASVQQALINTEKHMALLEKHHVIDAGALGWSYFFMGMAEVLLDKKLSLKTPDMTIVGEVSFAEGAHAYEVIFILEQSGITQEQLHAVLDALGDSLDIIITDHQCKVHIHTNQPELIQELAHSLGTVTHIQTIDMRTQAHTTI